MTDRELLQQALDALEAHADIGIKATKQIEALRARLAQPETVIQARKDGDLIVVDLPQVPTGSGGISKDTKREPILPGGGGGSGVPTIDGWPLYSGLPPQEEQGLTATPLPAIKLQDECESQYKSWAQNAQVIGGQYDPRRKWVGLTDEEIGIVIEASQITLKNYCSEDKQIEYARAIETMIKEKNYD